MVDAKDSPVTRAELREELSKYPTKQELKEELKNELSRYATKQDLVEVKEELVALMGAITEDIKRHFNFVAERIRADKNDVFSMQLDDHEKRTEKLEAVAKPQQ